MADGARYIKYGNACFDDNTQLNKCLFDTTCFGEVNNKWPNEVELLFYGERLKVRIVGGVLIAAQQALQIVAIRI